MVQANELRVGNWVQDNLCKYVPLSFDMLSSICSRNGENGLIPIPLTPEILVKCGFELHDGGQLPEYIIAGGLCFFGALIPYLQQYSSSKN